MRFYTQIKDINFNFKNLESLQQLAITSLLKTEGISAVLIGMRQVDYVDGVLKILKLTETKIDNKFWEQL